MRPPNKVELTTLRCILTLSISKLHKVYLSSLLHNFALVIKSFWQYVSMITTLFTWSILGFVIGFAVGISHMFLDKNNFGKYIAGGIIGSIAGGVLGESLVLSYGFISSSVLYALLGAIILSFYISTTRQF